MKAKIENKIENQDSYKLNIEHKGDFLFMQEAIRTQVDGLPISPDQRDELCRMINTLVELAEADAFFAGFKACAELVGESKK